MNFGERIRHTKKFTVIGCMLFASCGHDLWAQEIMPYLQSPLDTSIWITWKTSADSQSLVLYGEDSATLGNQIAGNCQVLSDPDYEGEYFYHSVQLTGLEPDSYYHYRTVSGTRQSAVYRFRTRPREGAGKGIFRFLVLGDHQVRNSDRYERLIKAARDKIIEKYGENVEEHVHLIINDGDQVDLGTLDQYEHVHFKPSALLSGNIPVMTTVGNHETYGSLGLSAYYDHFFYEDLGYSGIPSPGGENYYSYQQMNIVFVHLSSEHTTDQQVAWVQQIVDSVKSDPSVDWLICTGHRPIQAEQFVGDISEYIRSRIIPILAQTEKSTLFIGGHHHLYARGQVRDYPIYHIISGGASWDQFWGQSTERDFDDVQKTIDYWTYQIVTIDTDQKEMLVECYAAGSPKLGFTLDNILIDSFYRKFPANKPATPSIITIPVDSVELPFSFDSSPYPEESDEPYNSVHFQIASDSMFSHTEVDLIRDYENLYGTTGSPDYLPVDIHDTVNIFRYTIRKNALRNGTYHIRVRHRDRNISWSEWSKPVSFMVKGSSGGPVSISTPGSTFGLGESIEVSYEFGPGNDKDWIGIYRQGDVPGSIPSTDWEYVSGTSGNVTLEVTEPGQYFIAFFEDDGYYELTDRITVYVITIPVLNLDKAGYDTSDQVIVYYSNAPGIPNDWIGIYRLGETPGQIPSTLWTYTEGASGNISFQGLDTGYYFVVYFMNDGYTEAGERIIFSVGHELARLHSVKDIYQEGELVRINFENGPGLETDWIGIFRRNAPPGTPPLLERQYTNGTRADQVIFDQVFEPGPYYAAMYINNSTVRISGKAYFTMEKGNTGIKDIPGDAIFAIHNVGSTGHIKISLPGLEESILSLRITNITGQVVYENAALKLETGFSGEIDLSSHAAGVYLAVLRTGNQILVRKFVIH